VARVVPAVAALHAQPRLAARVVTAVDVRDDYFHVAGA
jgi:hypothetical protein